MSVPEPNKIPDWVMERMALNLALHRALQRSMDRERKAANRAVSYYGDGNVLPRPHLRDALRRWFGQWEAALYQEHQLAMARVTATVNSSTTHKEVNHE